jgi:hypothetical protein
MRARKIGVLSRRVRLTTRRIWQRLGSTPSCSRRIATSTFTAIQMCVVAASKTLAPVQFASDGSAQGIAFY